MPSSLKYSVTECDQKTSSKTVSTPGRSEWFHKILQSLHIFKNTMLTPAVMASHYNTQEI